MLTTSSSDVRLGPMSPDVLIMFNEAQRNIAELNRSRLNALDQLRAAKDRISELEVQLLQAREQQARVQTMLNGASCSVEARPPTSGNTANVSAAVATGVTVLYESGWDTAYLHYNADGKGWTPVPGEAMEQGTGEHAHCKMFCLPNASYVEFVINNGGDRWDKPVWAENYVVDGPGMYCVSDGDIQRLH